MGMKSNSNHFSGTNGARRAPLMKMNIQLFASRFKTPNDKNMVAMNPEKQQRHIGKSTVTDDKSKLTLSLSEAGKIISEVRGTGKMVTPYQEIVDCGRVIGYVEVDGELKPTTKAKIHYSKTGSHIVPYRDKEGKNDKRR